MINSLAGCSVTALDFLSVLRSLPAARETYREAPAGPGASFRGMTVEEFCIRFQCTVLSKTVLQSRRPGPSARLGGVGDTPQENTPNVKEERKPPGVLAAEKTTPSQGKLDPMPAVKPAARRPKKKDDPQIGMFGEEG